MNSRWYSDERRCVKSAERQTYASRGIELDPGTATLLHIMRKPFDLLAKGLLQKSVGMTRLGLNFFWLTAGDLRVAVVCKLQFTCSQAWSESHHSNHKGREMDHLEIL